MAFLVIVLVVQMIPAEALIISLFQVLDGWHLINTMIGLSLTYLVFVLPFTIWTLRGFVAGVPLELEEAAMVDGASRFGAFRRITLPLVAPGLVATGVFAFIQAWNEFIFALVIMNRPENQTLPVWLQAFNEGARGTDWGGVMAGSTLMAIPVIVFFLIVQTQGHGGAHGRGGEGMTGRRSPGPRRRRRARRRRVASIGVDIGATSTRVAAFDGSTACSAAARSRRRAGRRRWSTPSPGSSRRARQCRGRRQSHGGVAVGRRRRRDPGPGRRRRRHRAQRRSTSASTQPTPFGARPRRAALGVPVHVENDVNAAALGAAALLGVTPPSSLAYLSIGTGLAAGFVLDGRIRRGSIGTAGEIGHVPLRRDGPPCRAVSSGAPRRSARAGRSPSAGARTARRPCGTRPTPATRWRLACATIWSCDRLDDPTRRADARRRRRRIGGGVGELGEPLVRELRRWLAVEAEQSPLLATLRLGDRVDSSRAGSPGRRARRGAGGAPGRGASDGQDERSRRDRS